MPSDPPALATQSVFAPATGPSASAAPAEAATRAALRDWIIQRTGDPGPGGLDDHTPLFEQRILRSVHVPELILFMERISGVLIDVEELSAGHFRDIDTISKLVTTGADRAGSVA